MRERPRPISPLWVPACAGTTWFHRQSCLRAGIHPWDAGEAPPHIPPLGTRVRGHDVVPPSFLPPSRNPSLGRGRGLAPSPPSGYQRARARRGSTVIPASEQESIPGTREASPHLPPLGSRERVQLREVSTAASLGITGRSSGTLTSFRIDPVQRNGPISPNETCADITRHHSSSRRPCWRR